MRRALVALLLAACSTDSEPPKTVPAPFTDAETCAELDARVDEIDTISDRLFWYDRAQALGCD